MRKIEKTISEIVKRYPAVKLAYFFGSQVSGDVGPLSDYDVAVYLDERDKKQRFNLKLELIKDSSRALKTDKVDIVILNDVGSPELKFNIISHGKLIYEQEPYKVLVEPRILNEYFDFHQSLIRHGLTKSK